MAKCALTPSTLVAGVHTYYVAGDDICGPPVLVHNRCARGVATKVTQKGGKAAAKAAKASKNVITHNGHHAWPKYLGGPFKQALEKLPVDLHTTYHRGLDKVLPRWKSTKYYQDLSPLEQAKNWQKFQQYTEKFDMQHGTKLWDKVKEIAAAMP